MQRTREASPRRSRSSRASSFLREKERGACGTPPLVCCFVWCGDCYASRKTPRVSCVTSFYFFRIACVVIADLEPQQRMHGVDAAAVARGDAHAASALELFVAILDRG